jgi:FKBP-type peptidyl-prolyl cis-trans isomerase FkpA
MKKFVALAFCSVLLFSCNKGGGGKKVDLKTEDDKTLYAVGAMFGDRLSNLGLSEPEVDALVAGLRDKATNQKTQIDYRQYQSKVQALFKARMQKNADKVKTSGKDYLEKFVKSEGGKKTESGLAYKVIKPGEGASPKPTDVVEVHYHGTLIDGTVFDSSKERGKKVKFPLNRVIKGWTEGLQLLKPGGQIKLVIPSDLAYGDHGAPPKIPGGATLIFDVELFSVNSPEAPKAETPKKKK